MGFSRAPEDRPTPPQIYNYRVYLLTFICCLGSWMFGYNNGVIAGVLVLPSFVRDFHLPATGTAKHDNITSNIVSLLQIGGLCGAMATFYSMKRWGRKVALAIAATVYLIGAILQTFSYGRIDMMYIGRLITGLGAGSVTVVVPLYIAEISPPAIRGSLVGIYEINNQLSSLLGYWCNYIVNSSISNTATRQWQIPLAMQIVPSTLLVIAAIFVLPESPRFLVKKGKSDEARRVLAFVRDLSQEHEYINLEMLEINVAIEQQEAPPLPGQSSGKLGLFGELWWEGNRKRVLIGVALMFGQNMTGINGVNFYTPTIFRSIGFQGTKVVLLASGMYALVKTIATILSLSFFIDRLGRRPLLLTSSVGASLSLWYIGSFITAKNIDLTVTQKHSTAGWVAIVCIYIYAAFFSFAWNGVVWVYCAEIFPIRIKELSVCICTAVQWLSQFVVARSSPAMLTNLHGGFFFFYATWLVIGGAFVWFAVPETKGRTLEGMDEIFGNAYGREGMWRGGALRAGGVGGEKDEGLEAGKLRGGDLVDAEIQLADFRRPRLEKGGTAMVGEKVGQ